MSRCPARRRMYRQWNKLAGKVIKPIASVDELAYPGVWESGKELGEFLADLYASRRAGFS